MGQKKRSLFRKSVWCATVQAKGSNTVFINKRNKENIIQSTNNYRKTINASLVLVFFNERVIC